MDSPQVHRELERRSKYVWRFTAAANGRSQVKKPSLRSSSRSLYMPSIPQLEESTRPNLDKTLRSLLSDGDEVVVTDAKLPFELRFILQFSKDSTL